MGQGRLRQILIDANFAHEKEGRKTTTKIRGVIWVRGEGVLGKGRAWGGGTEARRIAYMTKRENRVGKKKSKRGPATQKKSERGTMSQTRIQ